MPVPKILTSDVFDEWLDNLRDRSARTRIVARIARLEAGNSGDAKGVGGQVSELRIDHGPGYRVYFTRRGEEWVILLAGGDKSTQEKDIRLAHAIAETFRGTET